MTQLCKRLSKPRYPSTEDIHLSDTFKYLKIKLTALNQEKTSQELRMLSSVTLNCQDTKIVINPGYQLLVL